MKINLTSGATPSRSVLASCQRRLNVYAEPTDPKTSEPGQMTHYPTPGLTLLGASPNAKPIRGLYRASNGDLYAVAAQEVYYVDPNWTFNLVGSMTATPILNPTKMADNGTSVILCDGTATNGYSISMTSRVGLSNLLNATASDEFTTSSTGWLGSTFVDFSDGYLIANYIGTPTFYISNSEDIIFDPLQFAGKTSYPDPLIAAIVQHRVIWLIGTTTTEVWYNTGGTSVTDNFPYSLMPGVAIDYGCVSPYSISKGDSAVMWLGQSQTGQPIVLRGVGYQASRVSTHAIEHELSTYSTITDCIAYMYMQDGHSFYVMNFPTADKTWVYDLAVGQWHQRAWLDNNGDEHRQRSTVHAYAYGINVVNDWQNGNLYHLDPASYMDHGQPIKRVISFPRLIDNEDDHRILFKTFIAEIATGESLFPADNPTCSLRWSDDKGKTWGNGILQPLGKSGHFEQFLKWNRLGLGRNRVFELEWSANALVALQGAFTEIVKAGA